MPQLLVPTTVPAGPRLQNGAAGRGGPLSEPGLLLPRLQVLCDGVGTPAPSGLKTLAPAREEQGLPPGKTWYGHVKPGVLSLGVQPL